MQKKLRGFFAKGVFCVFFSVFSLFCVFFTLHCDLEKTRFVSFGGQLNPEQPALIQSAARRLGRGEIILAMDNDDAGSKLAMMLSNSLHNAQYDDKEIRVHTPSSPLKDWNMMLTAGANPIP